MVKLGAAQMYSRRGRERPPDDLMEAPVMELHERRPIPDVGPFSSAVRRPPRRPLRRTSASRRARA